MTFWQVYGYIIAEFLFEYFVYAALFLHKLGRRKYFYFRAVPAVVALFALGLPVALFYKAFGATLWGGFWYTLYCLRCLPCLPGYVLTKVTLRYFFVAVWRMRRKILHIKFIL